MIDNNNGTVTDERTGLMWEQRHTDTPYSWTDATAIGIAKLNAAQLGGHTDWRLPTRVELLTLVSDTRYDPAIDPIFECQSDYYWSATTYQYSPSDAWYVAFYVGNVDALNKSSTFYVRGVRGGSLNLRSFDDLQAENAQFRAQLAQLRDAVQLLLESEDGGGRLSHNIGVPCGLCEAHKQFASTLADLPDAPKETT